MAISLENNLKHIHESGPMVHIIHIYNIYTHYHTDRHTCPHPDKHTYTQNIDIYTKTHTYIHTHTHKHPHTHTHSHKHSDPHTWRETPRPVKGYKLIAPRVRHLSIRSHMKHALVSNWMIFRIMASQSLSFCVGHVLPWLQWEWISVEQIESAYVHDLPHGNTPHLFSLRYVQLTSCDIEWIQDPSHQLLRK